MHTNDSPIDLVESLRPESASDGEQTAPRSFRGAVLAIVLAICGAYVVALIVDGGMLALGWYLLHRYDNRVVIQLSYLLIGFSILMTWSLFVGKNTNLRGARFNPKNQPELFEHIEKVARKMNEEPPAELILCGGVWNWAIRTGGILGIGGKPVVGFGLPFIQGLTISQFEALLALELAHLRVGQTGRLVTWISRAHMSLANSAYLFPGGMGFGMPFTWYRRLFEKVVTKKWFAMECASDLLVARSMGSDALISAICQSTRLGSPASDYFDRDIKYALKSGILPPVIEGFAAMLSSPQVIAEMDRNLESALKEPVESPERYDTPVGRRIARLQGFPPGAQLDNRPVLSIVRDLLAFEPELVRSMTRRKKPLKAIAWSEMGNVTWVSKAESLVARFARPLENVRLSDAFRLATTDSLDFGIQIAVIIHPAMALPGAASKDDIRNLSGQVLAAAIACRLHASGWVPQSVPGVWCSFKRGSVEFNPLDTMLAIMSNKMTEEQWEARIRECGLFPSMYLCKVSTPESVL